MKTTILALFLILVTVILASQYFIRRENELLIEHRDALLDYAQIVSDKDQEIVRLKHGLIKVIEDYFEAMKTDTTWFNKISKIKKERQP